MMAMNSLFSRRNWSPEGEETHVLAVDDSLVDRKVIEKLLKIYSCKVTAVDSGKRALQYLGLDDEEVAESDSSVVEGLKVDLIITDYCMPGLTGYELLKKIKESSAFRETPVVIMSSENVLARIDRCLEEGAEDFLVKPVKLSDMERLKEHFTGKDVLKSNKRKQPDGPDLAASPASSESAPSIGSPESSPSTETPDSSPSSPDSPSSRSEPLDSPSRRLKSWSSADPMVDDSPL